jgi:hypothetical protein
MPDGRTLGGHFGTGRDTFPLAIWQGASKKELPASLYNLEFGLWAVRLRNENEVIGSQTALHVVMCELQRVRQESGSRRASNLARHLHTLAMPAW